MNSPDDPRKFPFPPGIPLLALLAGWGLGLLWPVPIAWPAWTRVAGWLLIIAPFFLAVWAVATFRRASTAVNPLGKVTGIVSAGPFQFTRNPMYVSLMLIYIGGILAFQLVWSVLLLPVVFLLLQYVVIVPEERHLAAVFGEQYLHYQCRVRRWL